MRTKRENKSYRATFSSHLKKITGNLGDVYKWFRRDFLHERLQVSVLTLYCSQVIGRMQQAKTRTLVFSHTT